MAKHSPAIAKLKSLPRHFAFYAAAGVGSLLFLVTLAFAPLYAIAIGANGMFLTYLVLTGVVVPHLSADYLMKRPDEADAPVAVIFSITGLVVVVAVGALFITLNDGDITDPLEIVLSVVSVLLGWFTVHTMAGLHYAHEYYIDDPAGGDGAVLAGLDFPGSSPPDGFAFIYFSYVIGMTAQVADVAVSSPAMRLRVTLHGLFSFFFNTVIVAATVNVVVTLAGS